MARLLAEQWDLSYVDRASIWFDASALARLSREDAQRLEALPIRVEGDRVMVAVAEPTEQRLAELRRLHRRRHRRRGRAADGARRRDPQRAADEPRSPGRGADAQDEPAADDPRPEEPSSRRSLRRGRAAGGGSEHA